MIEIGETNILTFLGVIGLCLFMIGWGLYTVVWCYLELGKIEAERRALLRMDNRNNPAEKDQSKS